MRITQKQLKNKTIKACKEFLQVEDLELLECELIKEEKEKEILPAPIIPKIEVKNRKIKTEKYNPAVKPLFKSNFEKYEYLMKHGCTCAADRTWLSNFKNSKEYKEYEKDFC